MTSDDINTASSGCTKRAYSAVACAVYHHRPVSVIVFHLDVGHNVVVLVRIGIGIVVGVVVIEVCDVWGFVEDGVVARDSLASRWGEFVAHNILVALVFVEGVLICKG